MTPRLRNLLGLGLLAASLAAACGQEETIRVDLLPPGNARGEVATGMYAWSDKVVSTDCPAAAVIGTRTVPLPQNTAEVRACADVVQDQGYYAVDFFAFRGGTAGVTYPDYMADGGLWQAGQFRIGGVYSFGTGVIAHALIDGQYLPPSGTEIPRSFEGGTLVQVFVSDGTGSERYLCEIRTEFTGRREPGCGE
jgi:hypothetical protein